MGAENKTFIEFADPMQMDTFKIEMLLVSSFPFLLKPI
jgi:hypothetical protein